ncbi:IS5 family transposase [Actinacidiphila glaucinigra]|uniref:IS5 family transposase n=1 Tax=Actinacidiphila glaucinigra TaxID=235986 RepID=UPI002E305E2C|nr:IS5 family transposase [Actinacidiphila glaucinigra]
MPALPSWLTEPLWDQFAALLPERPEYHPDHPLGCHRQRIGDRIIFDKMLQLLRFGCSYEAIAGTTCSATTIRDRRDEWIRQGLFVRLKQIALESYGRIVGLVLDQIAVDGAITKAPGGGEAAGRSPVDRGKQGLKRSGMTDGYGIPLGRVLAGANRHDSPLLAPTLDRLNDLGPLPHDITVHLDAGYDSDKPARCSMNVASTAASPTRARRRLSRPASAGMSNAPTPGRTSSPGSPAATNGAPPSSTPSSTSPIPSSPYVA